MANTPSLCNVRNQTQETQLHPSILCRFLFNPFCKLQYCYRQGRYKLRIFPFGSKTAKKTILFTDSGLPTSGLVKWGMGHEVLVTAVNGESERQGRVGRGSCGEKGPKEIRIFPCIWGQGLPWLSQALPWSYEQIDWICTSSCSRKTPQRCQGESALAQRFI